MNFTDLELCACDGRNDAINDESSNESSNENSNGDNHNNNNKDEDDDTYEVDKHGVVRKSVHARRSLDMEDATIGDTTIHSRESQKSADDVITMEFEDCFRSKLIANNIADEHNKESMADWTTTDADTVDLRSHASDDGTKKDSDEDNDNKKKVKSKIYMLFLAVAILVSIGLIAYLSVGVQRSNAQLQTPPLPLPLPGEQEPADPSEVTQDAASAAEEEKILVETIDQEVVEIIREDVVENIPNDFADNTPVAVPVAPDVTQDPEIVPRTELDV